MIRPSGFTIVEMLVAILIMGIISVGGYPSLMGFAQEVRLEQEARNIYEDICLARESAASSGQGNSTVNFTLGIGNPADPITEYELVAPNGSNVRTALMDGLDVPSGHWRRQLATRSVCLLTALPNPLPGPFLKFDKNGALSDPPGLAVRLVVKFFLNNGAIQPIRDEVGTWVIEIAANSSRVSLRRIP